MIGPWIAAAPGIASGLSGLFGLFGNKNKKILQITMQDFFVLLYLIYNA